MTRLLVRTAVRTTLGPKLNHATIKEKTIMAVRSAEARWEGTLREGAGTLKLGSGVYEGPYTYASRFEDAPGTNPEELIGAAHAGCFSMFLAAVLTRAGLTPTSVQTTAKVHLEAGPTITKIELDCEAVVPNLDDQAFQEHAATAKQNCPVSKALSSVDIQLNARLV
jgi:lipoyl-dependent peroxiredoxin